MKVDDLVLLGSNDDAFELHHNSALLPYAAYAAVSDLDPLAIGTNKGIFCVAARASFPSISANHRAKRRLPIYPIMLVTTGLMLTARVCGSRLGLTREHTPSR